MKKKYPRTVHFPWSLGATNDDKTLDDVKHFIGREVVVTEKMDGENTTLARDYYHARSLDTPNHPSQCWIKAQHAIIKDDIPEDMRICGEYMFARHSIEYSNLTTYFYGFSVWNKELCLDWDTTQVWFDLIGITSVPVLYRGVFNEKIIRGLWTPDCGKEGYVVRLTDSFKYEDFGKSVAKFVRPNHVQTDSHWRENWQKNVLTSELSCGKV